MEPGHRYYKHYWIYGDRQFRCLMHRFSLAATTEPHGSMYRHWVSKGLLVSCYASRKRVLDRQGRKH